MFAESDEHYSRFEFFLHGGDRCIEAGLGGFIGQSGQREKLATIGSD